MLSVAAPYQPRPVRFLELWQEKDWAMKLYGIAHQADRPRPVLFPAAKEVARRHIFSPEPGVERYGVGFVGIHDGRGAVFVFVDYWADENELRHHVYVAPKDDPLALVYRTPTGLAACVWDLAVICFERQAWIDTVLANPAGPDLHAYLARRLAADI